MTLYKRELYIFTSAKKLICFGVFVSLSVFVITPN